MIFHLKRFLGRVADGGGRRCAAPKAQEARNEGLATNVLEPGDAKPFKANLRCQFYSTENSEEPGWMEAFVPMQLIEKGEIFLALTPLDLVCY